MEKQKDYSTKFNGQRFDCNQLFQKGIYYLYQNKTIVYIGMSTSNIMDRILKHYNNKDKEFDAYTIFLKPNMSNTELLEFEKDRIKKHNPKYNIIHNANINNSNDDYEIVKQIKDECWHTFIMIKDTNYVMCSKCGFKQIIVSKKSGNILKK